MASPTDANQRGPWGAPLLSMREGAFFWLSAFYVVYCVRPEDWVPGLSYVPLAKITGLLAFIALLTSVGRTKRRLRDLPREGRYLIALIVSSYRRRCCRRFGGAEHWFTPWTLPRFPSPLFSLSCW